MPDHSTFSKNRHGRFRASDTFRWLFDEVVRRCMAAGLVKGEGFAVDASVVAADASRQRGVPASEATDWSNPALRTRAVREYLEALDDEAFEQAVPPANLADRSAVTVDGRPRRSRILRLFEKLSDRYRAWRDPRRRSHPCTSHRRSGLYQDDGGSCRGTIRHHP